MKNTIKGFRAIEAAAVFVLLSSIASAAFTVQSFSCNSQSGTIVVENGGTLNCQATVKNTGSSSANMSSVTLLTDGTWAEKTTYTGLGFTSSVGAGATTTATFGNIKPTTSGVHKFNYVKIDSVTDNYPASSDVNVISIKNLVSTAPTNASPGENFTVSVSVTAGGNVNIVLTMNVSVCSLAAGEIAIRNLGTVSDNTVKTASWRVTQASGTCAYNVSASGSGGASSVSRSYSGTVPSSEVAIQVVSVNQTISTTADTPTNVSGGATNTSLEIVTSAGVAGGWVQIASHNGNPTGATFGQTSLGRYINITASPNITGNMSWAIISMQYTLAELTTANVNESTLWLYWYNGSSWVPFNESNNSGRITDTTPRTVWANTTHFSTFTAGGSSLSQTTSVSLRSGWNLISIPMNL